MVASLLTSCFPPIALLYAQECGPVVRGSLSLIGAIGIALAMRAGVAPLEASAWHAVAIGLPAVALGVFLGRRAVPYMNGARLRIAIAFLSGMAALALIGRRILDLRR